VWLTGLSGAGKSTLALVVVEQLARTGVDTEVLDGDQLRASLCSDLGFSAADRDTHVRRVGFLAEMLCRHGVLVLVPVIAPYLSSRQAVRRLHEVSACPYLEVHVATPLHECARRDPKGLYAKAGRGQLRGMTGVDDPYEEPVEPDLRVDTTDVSVGSATGQVLDLLERRGLLRGCCHVRGHGSVPTQ
jgi:adenylylsulfate kinase